MGEHLSKVQREGHAKVVASAAKMNKAIAAATEAESKRQAAARKVEAAKDEKTKLEAKKAQAKADRKVNEEDTQPTKEARQLLPRLPSRPSVMLPRQRPERRRRLLWTRRKRRSSLLTRRRRGSSQLPMPRGLTTRSRDLSRRRSTLQRSPLRTRKRRPPRRGRWRRTRTER